MHSPSLKKAAAARRVREAEAAIVVEAGRPGVPASNDASLAKSPYRLPAPPSADLVGALVSGAVALYFAMGVLAIFLG